MYIFQFCHSYSKIKFFNTDDADLIPSGEVVNVGGELKERACDSLIMCIITTLNQGLRNGGGIGDILRAPSSTVSFDTIFKTTTLAIES